MSSYKAINRCRISNSTNLVSVLDLGMQTLTGVFPKSREDHVEAGPLELVWCPDSSLVQLKHSFEPSQMYGENYGYRSGLNQSMVRHLEQKVQSLEAFIGLNPGDIVVDIGSNDATTLKAYKTPGLRRVGIDPTGLKFSQFYPEDIKLVPDFFSADAFHSAHSEPASLVTSIAMFYDLEDPVSFAKQIASILNDNGVWHFEQSYLPSMLRTNSYDTICHEHLEYYSLTAIENILDQADMRIIDVRLNDINGGSFAVTAAKSQSGQHPTKSAEIDWFLSEEEKMGINTVRPFNEFKSRVEKHRDSLISLVRSLNADGKTVLGYGASTKGNVTLQYCGFTEDDIKAIAEVNEEKFGCVTPGTNIPIVSEKDALAMKPDYFLVLPWHFKHNILQRERKYIDSGGKFIFPFPHIEIV